MAHILMLLMHARDRPARIKGEYSMSLRCEMDEVVIGADASENELRNAVGAPPLAPKGWSDEEIVGAALDEKIAALSHSVQLSACRCSVGFYI